MFQIKLHWEIYESLKLSHILLVVTHCRTCATSGCLFIYCVYGVLNESCSSPDTSNDRITGDFESDRMTNWSWLHLRVHYTDSNCKPHSGFRIACLRADTWNGILPKTVSVTTFDVTRVKQSNTHTGSVFWCLLHRRWDERGMPYARPNK